MVRRKKLPPGQLLIQVVEPIAQEFVFSRTAAHPGGGTDRTRVRVLLDSCSSRWWNRSHKSSCSPGQLLIQVVEPIAQEFVFSRTAAHPGGGTDRTRVPVLTDSCSSRWWNRSHKSSCSHGQLLIQVVEPIAQEFLFSRTAAHPGGGTDRTRVRVLPNSCSSRWWNRSHKSSCSHGQLLIQVVEPIAQEFVFSWTAAHPGGGTDRTRVRVLYMSMTRRSGAMASGVLHYIAYSSYCAMRTGMH